MSTGPERLRAAIARDRGHHAPALPVLLCSPSPEQGVLYLPAYLLPPDPRQSRQLIRDMRRELRCRVEVVYRADHQAPLRPLPRWRRLADRLAAPVARLMGF